MTELIYNYVSVEGVVLLILIGLIFSLYSRNKVETALFERLEKIQNSLDELHTENKNISLLQENIVRSLHEIESSVTTPDQKIDLLVKQGFPRDVAADLVLSDGEPENET